MKKNKHWLKAAKALVKATKRFKKVTEEIWKQKDQNEKVS